MCPATGSNPQKDEDGMLRAKSLKVSPYIFFLITLTVCAWGLAPALGQDVEVNTDLLGTNYLDFNVSTPDPGLCRSACAGDDLCSGWTYVKPGFQGPSPWCWLKTGRIDFRIEDRCCTSGVMRAPEMPPYVSTQGMMPVPGPTPMEPDFPPEDPPEDPQAMPGPGTMTPGAGMSGAYMVDTDLSGGDFSRVFMTSPDPALCEFACIKDKTCRAWTYVKPGYQGPKAQCWLKSRVPEARTDKCCVSAVKSGAPGAVEPPGEPPVPMATSMPEMMPDTGASMVEGNTGFEADTNRIGMDFRSFTIDTEDPRACQAACVEEPRCAAWTFVRPGVVESRPRCRLKFGVPEPVEDPCCVSGVTQ